VASKSKLLRVGSVEHRNRNHPLAGVILSGLSIEHLGVKFCRGKSREAISIACARRMAAQPPKPDLNGQMQPVSNVPIPDILTGLNFAAAPTPLGQLFGRFIR
jgi:hypothetical protein